MATHSKLAFSVGQNSFSAEGDNAWLSDQAKLFIDLISKPHAQDNSPKANAKSSGGTSGTGTLSTFLKTKDATTTQNKKFLATACWLQKNGTNELSTKLVTQALTDSKQTRLGNASDCLNQNVKQGYCQKVGKGFYVTPEGFAELGE